MKTQNAKDTFQVRYRLIGQLSSQPFMKELNGEDELNEFLKFAKGRYIVDQIYKNWIRIELMQ